MSVINTQQVNRVDEMENKQPFMPVLRSASILFVLLMVFAPSLLALNIEPVFVEQQEGTVIPLKISISASDWVKPTSKLANQCAGIGIPATNVVQFILKRKSGSADFSVSESDGDLHLVSNGKIASDPTILWCISSPYPAAQSDNLRSVVLHADNKVEDTELATVELWSVDLNSNKRLVASTTISILDGQAVGDPNANTNTCSSAALANDTPVSGSIATTDCDGSPRGAGYLADSFTFSGTAGETVSIDANWQSLDGYLYLEAPDGGIEDRDDNYSDTSDSQIHRSLSQSGIYRIWATTAVKATTGNYQISLSREVASLGDWSLISTGVTPTVLEQNEPLSIAVSGQKNGTPSFLSGGSVDVVYLLSHDADISLDDTELGSDNHCCGTGFEGLWEGVLDIAPGTYWVGACMTIVDDDAANNCTSTTEITVAGNGNAILACNTRALACGDSLAGTLSEASCTEGPQGPGYYAEQFTFIGASGSTFWLNANWDFDGYLILKNPGGKVVAENDNYTGASNSHIEHTLQDSGTYTIWATSYQPATMGAYDIGLDCNRAEGPDLMVDTPVLQADLLLPGQSIDLSAVLHNAGDQPSDSTTIHYVLSSDAQIDASDAEIGSDGAPGLAAGASSTRKTALIAPVTAGDYWIGACADQVADESAVSNNCSAGLQVEVKAQPNCTHRVLACGQSLSGTLNSQDCTRSPRGTGFLAEAMEIDATSGTALVADVSWTGIDGYLMLEDPSGAIVASNDDAGDLLHSRIEYAAQEDGTYRLWTTSQQRATSGLYSLDLTCGSTPEPDLVASAVSLSTSEVNVTDNINMAATVYNDGGSTSDASTVHFMLSSDEEISLDDAVIASQSLAAIPAGSSLDATVSVDVPGQAGNYWLGICVDTVAGETLTSNNCSGVDEAESTSSTQADHPNTKNGPRWSGDAGTLIEVSTGAACTSSAMSCGQNRSGTLGENDCDGSPRGTGYFSDIYSFSGNAGDSVSLSVDWNGVDGYLYLEDPTGQVVGENDDFQDSDHSRIEHVLEQSGTYHVWPAAHTQGQGGDYELNLTCNAPAAPDLLVDTPQLSTTKLRPGQNLSLTTQVFNQGNEQSADTSMRFILSSDEILSVTDRVLGKSDVTALSPGDSSLESLSVALDVLPGTYWVAACVAGDALELDAANNCALTGPLAVEQNIRPIDINAALNDAWYSPATPGQGFFINVFPDGDEMALSWFTYDVDRPDADVPFELGDPGHRWFTALGAYERGIANLDIYLNQGGVFDQSQPVPTESLYGTMTVSFSDCNHGQIEFEMPSVGEQGTIPITRVATDNMTACNDIVGAHQTPSPGAGSQQSGSKNIAGFNINPGLNDAWYNPATPGQGFSFNVFPHMGTALVSWFTFDTERPPEDVPYVLGGPGLRWLTALGNFQGDGAELTLYRVDGGVFNSASPAPQETEYGTLSVHFDDCNSGELHYDIPSLSRHGVVPIQRIATDTIPVCEQAQIRQDAALLEVTPGNKDVLENFCGGTANWLFDWPDTPQASSYIVELWRNDALLPMTFVVNESEFRYEKDTAIANEHLTGWKWRYQPQFLELGKTADFSPTFTFDVGGCE